MEPCWRHVDDRAPTCSTADSTVQHSHYTAETEQPTYTVKKSVCDNHNYTYYDITCIGGPSVRTCLYTCILTSTFYMCTILCIAPTCLHPSTSWFIFCIAARTWLFQSRLSLEPNTLILLVGCRSGSIPCIHRCSSTFPSGILLAGSSCNMRRISFSHSDLT